MGISVVMISYLGTYPGSRKNADVKFIRAVNSFKNQTLVDKELIIVSDGCEITNDLYFKNWSNDPIIKLIRCEKNESTWPGTLREVGRSLATYDWIHYLDTDDCDMPNHLEIINNAIIKRENNETVLFNTHYIFPLPEDPNAWMLAFVGLELKKYLEVRETMQIIDGHRMCMAKAMGHNGTWQIVHHRNVPHRWENSDHMGEDKYFIDRLKSTEKWSEFKGAHIHAHNTSALTGKRITIWEI
jgi:hypothetical protein